MSSPSPQKSKIGYLGSPQHLKTLDILGKTKSFAKLSVTDLSYYCDLAKSKYQCKSSSDAAAFLEDRYGWEVESRELDLQEAWDSLNSISDDDDVLCGIKTESNTTIEKGITKDVSDIPVIIKSNAMSRPVLICEVDDDSLHFAGDSGAVGRIFCDQNSLRLDLKGRQYSGQIMAGPMMMVLNFAPPVGQSSGKETQLCARAELLTNEFCHLEFEKDLHGTMQGVYTGDEVGDKDFGVDDNSDSDDAPVGKQKKLSSAKKAKDAAKAEDKDTASKPKISTITQRKRKSSGSAKKSGSSSKKSK